MHPPGPYFYAGARRPRIVDVLGHWELTLIRRWGAEGMVVFLLFFIHFARLVAIIGRSNSKNCIIYLLKTVLEVLVVMVYSAFGT